MTATRLGALLVCLVCAAAVTTVPEESPALEADDAPMALAADDECAADTPGGCALSALQLRGVALAGRQASEAEAVAEAQKPEDSNAAADANGLGAGPSEDEKGTLSALSCALPFDPKHTEWSQDCRLSRSCCNPAMTCFEKGPLWAGCMYMCAPGVNYLEPASLRVAWTCKILGGARAPQGLKPTTGYNPISVLRMPSTAPVYTFYVYRAVSDAVYAPYNVNAANLPGVMWYLQNEVVITRPRKFGITRIVRMKVQTKAPRPLFEQGMNFGVRYAFDSGMCTGPFDCNEQWQKYGYFVGCNNLGEFPFPTYKVYYPGAIWYSFPGPCPSRTLPGQSNECKLQEPGGACPGTPTGTGDCTYSFSMAGEIRMDDLERAGGPGFWARPQDESACSGRVKLAATLFAQKYPGGLQDWHLPSPKCDFNYANFFNR